MQNPFLPWTADPQNQSSTRPKLKTIQLVMPKEGESSGRFRLLI